MTGAAVSPLLPAAKAPKRPAFAPPRQTGRENRQKPVPPAVAPAGLAGVGNLSLPSLHLNGGRGFNPRLLRPLSVGYRDPFLTGPLPVLVLYD